MELGSNWFYMPGFHQSGPILPSRYDSQSLSVTTSPTRINALGFLTMLLCLCLLTLACCPTRLWLLKPLLFIMIALFSIFSMKCSLFLAGILCFLSNVAKLLVFNWRCKLLCGWLVACQPLTLKWKLLEGRSPVLSVLVQSQCLTHTQ